MAGRRGVSKNRMPRRPKANRYNPNAPDWRAVHQPGQSVLPGGLSLLNMLFPKGPTR